jgi:FkbM family methyltransferase
VSIFNEIFSRRMYELPGPISTELDAIGPLRVLDLGGNIGLFGVYALGKWPIAAMRSFEPEPANAAILRATIDANRAASKWQVDPRAVSNANTQARFTQGLYADGYLAADGELEVRVADLFDQDAPHLLKIDIEGGEWALLTDPRLPAYNARVIVLEWHTRGCPAEEPHRLARTSLKAAGFILAADRPSPTGRNGLIWAMRPKSRTVRAAALSLDSIEKPKSTAVVPEETGTIGYGGLSGASVCKGGLHPLLRLPESQPSSGPAA